MLQKEQYIIKGEEKRKLKEKEKACYGNISGRILCIYEAARCLVY